MSFLAKYWNAVERAVSETGMNSGDYVVDITELLKDTEVTDTVQPETVSPEPTIEPPAQAGHMPDQLTMEEMVRGLARPAGDFQELEAQGTRARTATSKKVRTREELDLHDGRPQTRGKKKKVPASHRKALKKLGGGRRVNLVLDRVTVNGTHIWQEPCVDV